MRGKWVWDDVLSKWVTREALNRRRAKAAKPKRATLFVKRPEFGAWVYDHRTGERRPKSAGAPRVAGPHLGVLGLDYVQNPVDGQRYTCMRAYERAVKRGGCEIVAGMDPKSYLGKRYEGPSMAEVVGDVKRSLEELNSR